MWASAVCMRGVTQSLSLLLLIFTINQIHKQSYMSKCACMAGSSTWHNHNSTVWQNHTTPLCYCYIALLWYALMRDNHSRLDWLLQIHKYLNQVQSVPSSSSSRFSRSQVQMLIPSLFHILRAITCSDAGYVRRTTSRFVPDDPDKHMTIARPLTWNGKFAARFSPSPIKISKEEKLNSPRSSSSSSNGKQPPEQ